MTEKFIPRGKLGKKARRLVDSAKRRTWDRPPFSTVMTDKKTYNRSRIAARGRDDGDGFFYFWQKRTGPIRGPQPAMPIT